MEEELSDVERWQKSEDERLEYEGYSDGLPYRRTSSRTNA